MKIFSRAAKKKFYNVLTLLQIIVYNKRNLIVYVPSQRR
jgi:hypothetical protein